MSLQNILSRNLGKKKNVNDMKAIKEDRVSFLLERNEDLALAGRVSKETIDHLTQQIHKIEWVVQKRTVLKESYRYLLTLPGVVKILSLTIMLDTEPISRFETVGDYVLYFRKVPSQWMSNRKWKEIRNRKNGNKYLAWAYSEASEFDRQLYPEPRDYYKWKMQKTNAAVAHSALANKLSRARYYVMRDQVPSQPEKLFG